MNQINESTLIPIGLVILIIGAVITVYKWVDGVNDKTKENKSEIKRLADEHLLHKEVHQRLQGDIEKLKQEGQMIISDIANLRTELRTDIATLSTKLDLLLDYFKNKK